MTSNSTSYLELSAASDVTPILCYAEDAELLLCNGTIYSVREPLLDSNNPLFWTYLITYVVLMLAGGLFAGLTLAVMSLDVTSLKVVIAAGSPRDKKYATRILPFVQRNHLLLVTLVLGNAACVETMPIFLDRLSDPVVAVLVSATAVLIFGELLPQAVCSRYGLAVGYYMSWMVWVLVALFFPISYPLSLLLDLVFGHDTGTFYRRKELEALVDIHGLTPKAVKESISCMPRKEPIVAPVHEHLSVDEVNIIKGALNLTGKRASQAMVPLSDVYMLSADAILNENLLREIFEMGHSRLPVYSETRDHILGIFLTKRLITMDYTTPVSLRQLIEDNPSGKTFHRGFFVDQNLPLYELLHLFQIGIMTHMAFVADMKTSEETTASSNPEKVLGIITLEDVIEELLQEEIYDEADIRSTARRRRANALRSGKVEDSTRIIPLNVSTLV